MGGLSAIPLRKESIPVMSEFIGKSCIPYTKSAVGVGTALPNASRNSEEKATAKGFNRFQTGFA